MIGPAWPNQERKEGEPLSLCHPLARITFTPLAPFSLAMSLARLAIIGLYLQPSLTVFLKKPFSLSSPRFLFPPASSRCFVIWLLRSSFWDTRCIDGNRTCLSWGGQLPSHPIAAFGGGWLRMGRSRLPSELRHCLAIFHCGSGCQQVPLFLLVVMVASVCTKSAQIIGTPFYEKWKNFDSWSKPNRALFWGKDLEFLIVAKYAFQSI